MYYRYQNDTSHTDLYNKRKNAFRTKVQTFFAGKIMNPGTEDLLQVSN